MSKSVDGYFYYIDSKLTPSLLTEDQKSSVMTQVKEKLGTKGFKVVSKIRKAYLTVYIYEQSLSIMKEIEENPYLQFFLKDTKMYADVNVSYSKKTVSYQNGQLISKTETSDSVGKKDQFLGIAIYVNAYGKRPELYYWARVNLLSSSDVNQAVQSLVDKLDKDLPKAPKQNKKMKGDPGCTPQFGFQTQDAKSEEESSPGKVTEVLPGSSAAKMGMRVGDIILAIDSVPYSSRQWEKAEIYEKFIPVPIKFTRQNQIFRKMITSQIQCDNN